MSRTCTIVKDMNARHFPPAGQSLIAGGHIMSESCPCNPEKKTVRKLGVSGRRGRHQGYKTETVYYHKSLETS